MVDIAGHYDENAEVSQFDRLPAFTDQRAKIIESAVVAISDKENKGRCLQLTWQLETGAMDGRLFWQKINLWPENMNNIDQVITISNSQFAAIRQATGKLTPRNTEELHHIPCSVSYGPQKKNPDYDEVKSVKPIASAGAVPGYTGGQRQLPGPNGNAPGGQRKAPWPARQNA